MEENKNLGEIVIFNTDSGDVKVQIDAINETIWMTQKECPNCLMLVYRQ